MSTTPLHRRLYVGVLSTGLLAGLLIPLTQASAATATCPTYVDAAEDSAPVDPALSVLLQDGQLDILSITHSTSAGVLSSTVALTALNDFGSDYSIGDWYEISFTVAEKLVSMRVVRDANLTETTTTRLQVDGVTTDVVPEAVYDFQAKTVALKVKAADLEKVVAAKLSGKPFSAMSARSLENYSAAGLTWDTATAGEGAAYVFGTACKGATAGAAPKPAASAAPTASASPAGSPSAAASPSGSPTASTSAAPSASASPTGPPPSPEPTVPVPAAGCFGFLDAEGDARPGAQAPNDPDLDILAVTGRTEAGALAGHLQIDELGEGPSLPVFSGHRFEYEFSLGGKVVLLRGTTTGPGTATVDGVAAPDLKVAAVLDLVSSQVVLSVDRQGLAKVLGREIPEGTFLENQIGRSAALAPGLAFAADTATTDDAARARYTVGDNTCFAPKLSVSLPGSVQTSDVALISVSMTTSDGRTAAGQTVTARVGDSRAVSGKTDKQGNVTVAAPVSDASGQRLLTVRSTGSAGKGELTSEMRVLVEGTILSASTAGSGVRRTVTATLTDDDDRRRALAGQRITFTFGGRTVTASTDSAGRAATNVPAGSVVDVAFAGRSGFLTPSKRRLTAR